MTLNGPEEPEKEVTNLENGKKESRFESLVQKGENAHWSLVRLRFHVHICNPLDVPVKS